MPDADRPRTRETFEIEARRILERYRRLILLGQARLPLEQARRIVGPDCAYHLYFRHASSRRRSPRRGRQ